MLSTIIYLLFISMLHAQFMPITITFLLKSLLSCSLGTPNSPQLSQAQHNLINTRTQEWVTIWHWTITLQSDFKLHWIVSALLFIVTFQGMVCRTIEWPVLHNTPALICCQIGQPHLSLHCSKELAHGPQVWSSILVHSWANIMDLIMILSIYFHGSKNILVDLWGGLTNHPHVR